MYRIIIADRKTIETSQTAGVIHMPVCYFYAMGRAYILAFATVGASIGINLDVHERTVSNGSERRAYRAGVIAEIAP